MLSGTDLADWLALSRVHAGRVTQYRGQYLDDGQPMPRYDPWLNARRAPIPQSTRVEQVAVTKANGAPPSRLGKHGQVLGQGTTRLTVLFDGENTPVSIRLPISARAHRRGEHVMGLALGVLITLTRPATIGMLRAALEGREH